MRGIDEKSQVCVNGEEKPSGFLLEVLASPSHAQVVTVIIFALLGPALPQELGGEA